MPIPTTRLKPQVLAADETAVWGKLDAPSSPVAPLFRFEPRTRRFDYFDVRAGLPESAPGRLISLGTSVWLLHEEGAFRFDATSRRFVKEAALHALYVVSTQEGIVWIGGNAAKSGDPTLFRWSRATGKTVPEERSRKDYCRSLLASGNGILIASGTGLFRVSGPDAWEPVDTWEVTPANLVRGSDGAIWVAGDWGKLLRIDARAGL